MDKLSQFKEHLTAEFKKFNSMMSYEELKTAIQTLIDFVKKAEQNLIKKIDGELQTANSKLASLQDEFNQVIADARKESDNTFAGFKRKTIEAINSIFLKNKVNEKLKSALNEVDNKITQINDKMAQIRDGKDADEDIVAEKASNLAITAVLKQIPPKDDLNVEIPKLGGLIASALELMPDGDKLKIEAIEGLKELIEELKSRPLGGRGGGGFSLMAMQQHFAWKETPSGAVNGVNTDFTLTETPNPEESLTVYRGGAVQILTEDYTFSGKTITFLVAPVSGEIIRCDYIK